MHVVVHNTKILCLGHVLKKRAFMSFFQIATDAAVPMRQLTEAWCVCTVIIALFKKLDEIVFINMSHCLKLNATALSFELSESKLNLWSSMGNGARTRKTRWKSNMSFNRRIMTPSHATFNDKKSKNIVAFFSFFYHTFSYAWILSIKFQYEFLRQN